MCGGFYISVKMARRQTDSQADRTDRQTDKIDMHIHPSPQKIKTRTAVHGVDVVRARGLFGDGVLREAQDGVEGALVAHGHGGFEG